MRAKRTLGAPAAYLAAGAFALVLPATAFAVTETQPGTGSRPSTSIRAASATSTTSARRPRSRAIHRRGAVLALNSHDIAAAPVGAHTEIRGALRPSVGLGGRHVELEIAEHGHWVRAAETRTDRTGHFAVRYRVSIAGAQRMRAVFTGDRFQTAAYTPVSSVTGLSDAEVSWYYDAGNTACGFHATYGIASRTLPCGSHVTLSYGGRTVVATVDDRGPFVYSRLYDLNQTTAQALGMDGVATVLASD